MSDDFRDEMIGCLPRLRRFALALTGNPEGADDLVQESCLRALSRVDQFEKGTRLDSWMFRITQNIWLDKQRSRQARGVHVDLDETPTIADAHGERRIEGQIAIGEVSRAIARLPDDLQMLVMLICVDGRSYKDASEMLCVPIGTVMSRLARARRMLHDTLYSVPESETAMVGSMP